jgi:hypothetical protein
MSIEQTLLADFIIIGIACGCYLHYRSYKVIGTVPARSERSNRILSRAELLKVVEGISYACLGVLFDTLSLSQAFLP